MISLLLLYFACGILVGFLSGLLGIGGGIIGIPILLTFFTHQQGFPEMLAMHMAIATILATTVPTTMIASYKHWQNNLIDFKIVIKMLPGLLMGCIIGTIISSDLHPVLLQKIFSFFLCFIAFQMLFFKKIKMVSILINQKIVLLITFLMGMISSLLGLGGGILMIPFLRWNGISTKQAIGISTACIVPIAILGSISYVLNGIWLEKTYHFSSGFIYWPAFIGISMASMIFAPVGASLTLKLSARQLNTTFLAFVIIAALKLFFIQ